MVYVIFSQSDDLAVQLVSLPRLKCDIIVFNLYYNSQISDSMAFKLGMAGDLCMTYLLMLVLMTLTLMQAHSGSAKAQIQC